MDSIGHNRELGLVWPKPRGSNFEESVWFAFRDEFSELIEELLQFSEDSLRANSDEPVVNPWDELFGYLCDFWSTLKVDLADVENDSELVQINAHKAVTALTHFAMLATEPRKPSGIGSKSKVKELNEYDDPIRMTEELDGSLRHLIDLLENNAWIPVKAVNLFNQASSSLLEGKATLKRAVFRSKSRTQREAAIFESLREVYQDHAPAENAIKALISSMQKMNFSLNDHVDGWRDRIRHFYKNKN